MTLVIAIIIAIICITKIKEMNFMSKKELNENEINKISAGVNAKDVGYGTLGAVALAGGVATFVYGMKRIVDDDVCYTRAAATKKGALQAFYIITSGLLTSGGAFALSEILSKIGKDKNDNDSNNKN